MIAMKPLLSMFELRMRESEDLLGSRKNRKKIYNEKKRCLRLFEAIRDLDEKAWKVVESRPSDNYYEYYCQYWDWRDRWEMDLLSHLEETRSALPLLLWNVKTYGKSKFFLDELKEALVETADGLSEVKCSIENLLALWAKELGEE